MARFTPIYGAFVSRLDEIALLRSKASSLSRTKMAMRHGAEINALCRGSVVLLSSHIEAYVKELGEHSLDTIFSSGVCRSKIALPFFYHISRERIDNIRRGENPAKIARHVRSFVLSDSEMWKMGGGFPSPIGADDFNTGFSNPKFEKVRSYLARFGYGEFRRDFFVELGRNAQSTLTSIDHIVDTRNAIAHGDPSATKTPNEVKNMIDASKVFCRTVDNVFASWCAKTLCKIR
jgi:RiboL-PSP-HEPN